MHCKPAYDTVQDEEVKGVMDWQYVALEWRTGHSKQDTTFVEERREMLDRGWTEHLRALWPAERMPRRLAGGICIMRRLKEGPRCEGRLWTEREIESLFESWYERLYAGRGGDDAASEAQREGPSIRIMRAAVKREWSEEELDAQFVKMLGRPEFREAISEYLYPLVPKGEERNAQLQGRVREQADLCGRLERRNAELQAGIDAVAKTERSPGPVLEDHHYDAIRGAIHKYLYPLATKTTVAHGSNWTIKEESNG